MRLAFDPIIEVAGLRVRWEAVGLAVVLLLVLALWIVELRDRIHPSPSGEDIAFVLLAVIPGAVVGGRLVHALGFHEVYLADPRAAFDFGRGSLSLVGAVVGGCLTGGYLCRLLGGRVSAWADAAALPLLVGIGAGKLALLLGGAGQGMTWEGPLALAFDGPGPWRAVDPSVAAWPAQALEGAWALLGVVPVMLLGEHLRGGRRDGRGVVFLFALAWWLAGRLVVALTWRDEPLLGPLGAEGIATVVVLAGVLAALVISWRIPAVGPTGYRTPP
ncbi:MAG: prolipoprotein diacylglyceryl transferase [Chloroflexi bacterium]|nr:prolipoprotein diacylglyceryl transferase [Chloroflexota bacterium]